MNEAMVTYHNGDAILLNGETEWNHGAEWYVGTCLVGPRKGETVVVRVDNAYLENYEDVQAEIEEENANYQSFIANM